jgi:hypothetical protein
MPHAPSPRSGAPRIRLASRFGVLGLATATAVACSSDPTAPLTTTTPPPNPGGRLTVLQYMAAALDTIQGLSINESVAKTTAFREKYLQQASTAKTYRELYPIIRRALGELDPHSSLSVPENLPGSTDAPVDRPDLRVQGRMAAPRIAYLWVPGYIGRNQQGRVDSTHTAMKELDANNPCGWVVDLRRNNGGFFYALMASVGPLYAVDNGTVGGQRYSGNFQVTWNYRRRADGTDAFVVRSPAGDSGQLVVQSPFRPRRVGLPVAVLHSTSTNAGGQFVTITASAGESISLAFRGGPPSRSFGAQTYGVASGRYPMRMIDSARIDITDSYMFDRRGGTPGNDPMEPDVRIATPGVPTFTTSDTVVTAAVEWLQSQSACTTGAADRLPTPRAQRSPSAEASAPTGVRRPLPSRDAVYALPDPGFTFLP